MFVSSRTWCFHHNLHRPAKKHNQFFCHDLCIRPVLHYYMIQCESKEPGTPCSIQDVPLFHQLLLVPQWCLFSDRSPCGWSAPRLSGNVDSSQEALLPTVFKGCFGYIFAKMLTNVCSMYMYVQCRIIDYRCIVTCIMIYFHICIYLLTLHFIHIHDQLSSMLQVRLWFLRVLRRSLATGGSPPLECQLCYYLFRHPGNT